MLQHIKLLQSPIHPVQTRKQHASSENSSSSCCPVIPKQCSKFSRRELTVFTNSSLLLLLTSQTLEPYPILRARAEEIPEEIEAKSGQEATGIKENPLEVEAQSDQAEAEPKENSQAVDAQNDQLEAEPKETPIEVGADENDQPKAETKETGAEIDQAKAETSADNSITENSVKRAFLEISIDGKPAGRIIIRLNDDSAPVGAARFSDLVSGRAGVSYRRKEFVKIMPNYVQHGGVRSYGVDAELASATGRSLTNERLIEEWEKLQESAGTKNLAGTVSIIIRDPLKPPPKMKLVARQGKLQIDQEEVGVEPNGTEFTIATRDSPELDSSALVIGKVIEGMDVVEKIGQVKTVQDNKSSPYFRVAKIIGDKRAVVAERGFNRPYSKVTITNCGFLE